VQEYGQFFDAEATMGPPMDLELISGSNSRTIREVEEADLACIATEEAVILSDGKLFMQCSVTRLSPKRYLLEYQDGSGDEHYRAVDEHITLGRVLSAFRKYLGRDPSWRTDFQWEKLEL
jgi:hypothetical protein